MLLDGRTRTLAWNEIARSEGPSFPSAAPPPEDDLDPLRPGPGRVPLVVESAGGIGENASFDPRPLYIGGGIAMGVGAAMIATGAVLIAKAKGGVEEEDSTATPRATRSLQVDAGPMRGGGWVGATVRF